MSTNSAGEFPIKIYLLAENRLLREVIVRLFRKRRDVTVAGVSHEGAEALDELAVTPCDVLLLDSLKILRAVERRAGTTECLKKNKVLLFGMEMDSDCFFQALQMGVCGTC